MNHKKKSYGDDFPLLQFILERVTTVPKAPSIIHNTANVSTPSSTDNLQTPR